MKGSITYKDGRVYNYQYELVYLPGEFSPLPIQKKRLWKIG